MFCTLKQQWISIANHNILLFNPFQFFLTHLFASRTCSLKFTLRFQAQIDLQRNIFFTTNKTTLRTLNIWLQIVTNSLDTIESPEEMVPINVYSFSTNDDKSSNDSMSDIQTFYSSIQNILGGEAFQSFYSSNENWSESHITAQKNISYQEE